VPDVKQRARYQLVCPNLSFARYRAEDGVKHFELTAEEIRQPVTGGVWIRAWGYNGSTPGPLFVLHEHDHVRIHFRNRLPEATAIHWHGLVLPNDQDGVPMMSSGPYVAPGHDHVYEFTVRQTGTFLYHAHVLSSRQQMMGLGGMMVVLPLERASIDKEFAVVLQQWSLQPDGITASLTQEQAEWAEKHSVKCLHRINPLANAHNYFTLNGKAFPDTAPLAVRSGDWVRIRIGNLGVQEQPMHLHGHVLRVTAVDGQPLPTPYQTTTVNVAPGETVDVEFVANNPGVWAFHSNKPLQLMNGQAQMGGMMTTLRYTDAETGGSPAHVIRKP
jgi:FtsP/CotA-like multicopper oxidase with cupredoxin domain